MLVTTCGNSEKLAQELAKKLRATYSPLTISAFPDGDLYLKFNITLKGKTLVIVESLFPHSQKSLLDIIFAAETAKDLGAKRVILIAPYLAYMRQDKRFHPGEAISSKIMAKLLNNSVDKIITIDPHAHRYRNLRDIFTIPAVQLTSNHLIAAYVKKHWKKAVLLGPDWESSQWAARIAEEVGFESTILKKTRHSSRHVSVKLVKTVKAVSLQGKDVVIIDDIISTGKTIAEAAKLVRRLGAKTVTAIGVHGLFVENALPKLKTAGVNRIVTSNCIEHPTNRVDVVSLLVKELEKER
ncbi:ribose-phosphate diphosphokinase [Candidatus Woesearchaeota archaeon]|nr:ribose-phosphate diphosphokinase [Candidatus Woesearchaeota archaeon]